MYFNRQSLRIAEKGHRLVRVRVQADRLAGNSLAFQLPDHIVHRGDEERQMPQTICLWIRHTRWSVLHDEQFQLCGFVNRQIDLPVVPFRPIVGSNGLEAELVDVEVKRRILIGTDNGDVMDPPRLITS